MFGVARSAHSAYGRQLVGSTSRTLCIGGDACAGSPKVLELFRSNRVVKAGRLHWAILDCAPHSARRVFSDSPLTVPMVRGEKCVLSPGLGSDSTLTSHTQHWMYCVHD